MKTPAPKPSKPSFMQRLGLKKSEALVSAPSKSVKDEITPSLAMEFGLASTSVAALMRGGRQGLRHRQSIYEKWARMEADPIVSSALMLLCTAALGGHETTGQLVFIETAPDAQNDAQKKTLVDEIGAQLTPLLNRAAFSLAYTGAAFGDAYARVYADDSGVIDLYTDEMVRPMLVQPFERGSRTVGYAVSIGEKMFDKLDGTQMVRMKMPRTQWIPQTGVFEKSMRVELSNDDLGQAALMPAMAGGSLLYNAEDAYDNLSQALAGLIGQRWMDSMDEQIMTLQMESMTRDQQERFARSITNMLKRSKAIADRAAQEGRPVLERIRHIIPVFGEKQLATMSTSGSGRVSQITTEDVMFHARMLSGAIGIDLSMIGFADQMSGGLGEGGFFRVSAQAAERARVIRVALADCFDSIIDLHCLKRYGANFKPSERPWRVSFYGSISALESERQKTRTEAMNTATMLGAALQAFKELGATRGVMSRMMSKEMGLDEDMADLLASMFPEKAPDPLEGMGEDIGQDMPQEDDAGADDDL